MKKKSLIVLSAIALLVFMFWLSNTELNNIEAKAKKEYPIVEKKDFIDGIVNNVYHPPKLRKSPYFVSFLLQDGVKTSLSVKRRAIGNSKIAIGDVIVIGTSIVKKANSDTVEVTTDEEKYQFLIDSL